jgi:hypothetical protein
MVHRDCPISHWTRPRCDSREFPKQACLDPDGRSSTSALFKDLLGCDKTGNIKPKNEWQHAVNWDLVVFDEYHFGAWRDTAKELFEGGEEAAAQKELSSSTRPHWTM